MRKGWTETTLGDAVAIKKGKKPQVLTSTTQDSSAYLTAEVLRGGSCEQFVPANSLDHCVSLSGAESVLLWDGAGAGDVFRSQPGVLASTMAKIESSDQTFLNSDFLFTYLDFKKDEIKASCRGTTVPHVSPEALKSLKLLTPPLQEQKRIVDVVSSVDTYIAALQQQADKARAARNAVLHELLSAGGEDWTETTIGEIAVVKGGKRLPKGTPWSDSPTDHPYIRATDIRDGNVDVNNLVYVPDSVWPSISRYVVNSGDVLITIAGTIGAIGIVPDSHIGANLTENAALIRPNIDFVLPKFLQMFMMQAKAQAQIESLTIGTTQKKLGLFRIESIEIWLPSLAEQQRVVEIVSSMDDVIQSTEQAVADAKAFRSGLLSDLLSGNHEIPASYDSLLGAA